MNNLSKNEQYFTHGPFGNGTLLTYDFEQFQDGMIDLLYKVTGKKLSNSPLSQTAAGKIAIAGTCIMAAATLGKDYKAEQNVKELIDLTFETLHQQQIDEVTLATTPKVTLLDAKKNCRVLRLLLDRFEQNLADSGVKAKIITSPASIQTKREIEKAMAVLQKTIPNLSKDVMPMISAVLPISTGVESAFVSPTPLLIYIDPVQFTNPLDLADALIHEALHQKLLTIRLTKRLLRPGYNDFKGMSVPIPWGSQNFRMFSTGRALAAAHVYVHLTLLHASAFLTYTEYERKQELGNVDIVKNLSNRFSRASYLVETLSMRHYRHEFGADGLDFLQWLQKGLQSISTNRQVKEALGQYQPSSVG